MSERFTIETSQDSQKPILLLFGQSPLISLILKQHESDFTILLVSDEEHTFENKNIHVIKTTSAYLIDKLAEKLDYAVFELEKDRDAKILILLEDKLKKDTTKTIVLIPVQKTDLFYELASDLKRNTHVTIFFLGEIFGATVLHSSPLAKIITQAAKQKTILLSGNDLLPIFPISETDALHAVNLALFGVRLKHSYYYLFYEKPENLIAAVHLLRRVDPELTMQFAERGTTQEFPKDFNRIESEIEKNIHVTPEFLDPYFLGFEKSIQGLFEGKALPEFREEKRRLTQPILKTRKGFSFFIKPLFVAIIIFILINVLSLFLGLFFFKRTFLALANQNIPEFQSDLRASEFFNHISFPTLTLISTLSPSSTLSQELSAITGFQMLLDTSQIELHELPNLSVGLSTQTFNKLISDTLFSYFKLEELASLIGDTNSCTLCLGQLQKLNSLLSPNTSRFLSISSVLPDLLGYTAPKNYLLLFQDNGELRPTGGFIGSVGELTLNRGKIEKLTVRDVYDLDGQLKDQVTPPFIVRRYIGPNLYLRDSNFPLNFEDAASTSALLYNLETNRKVDGVIGIDFEVLRQIIHLIGPISLPNYNKVIDENSAFEFLQNTIDKNFFPGSTQKKDVLNALLTQIILDIEQKPNITVKLASLLPTLFSQKHILIALPMTQLQSVFSVNNYSGDYFDLRAKNTEGIYDSFSVNEANIGINKANYTLKRSVEYTVILGSPITSRATVTFNNTDSKSLDYKAYLRIVAPSGSELTSVLIDGKAQTIIPAITDPVVYEASNFKPPPGLEVNSVPENNSETFGFVVTVPKNTSQTIEVTYKNGLPLPELSQFDYSLWYGIQPGVTAYPLTVQVKYPSGYSPQNVTDAYFGNNALTIQKTVQEDTEFRATFIKPSQ